MTPNIEARSSRRRSARLGAAALILGLGATMVTTGSASAAPTPVPITVSSDAYATDGSGQITSTNEFLYDSAKGDDPSNAYQIAYRGTLDMTQVWSSYQSFRGLWLMMNGGDQARWAAKTFSGTWQISFTVDTTVVSANPTFVDCAVVQSEMAVQNPGTSFGDIMRCDTVSYSAASGQYVANFSLHHANGDRVTGADLDNPIYRPAALVLTTPPQALYVMQANYQAGRTFSMVDPTVTGEMTMDAFYIGMPLTFNDVGDPVTLTMVDTHDATFAFQSCTAGRTLPAGVTALTPAPRTMLRTGDVVTPQPPAQATVVDGQGSWTFAGWNPASATVADADLQFTACWNYAVDPGAQFAVNYVFIAQGGDPLPAEITGWLPAATTATQGSNVTPSAPVQTMLEQTTVSGKTTTVTTWTFAGWDPASTVINGADIEFVGTWVKTVTVTTEQTPVTPATPAGPNSQLSSTGASGSPMTGWTVAALLLLLGATGLVAAQRRNQTK